MVRMRDFNHKKVTESCSLTKLFSRTLIRRRLFPPIGLIIAFGYYNGLRMSQLIIIVYRMCLGPSPLTGGGLLF